MTHEEAEKIGKIVAHADGGCSVCVVALVQDLNESFPEFVWVYDEKAEPPPEPPLSSDEWDKWNDSACLECRVSVRANVG